jgi:hypothetical protein
MLKDLQVILGCLSVMELVLDTGNTSVARLCFQSEFLKNDCSIVTEKEMLDQ